MDRQNEMRTESRTTFFELKGQHGVELGFEDMDEIMEECLKIARLRYA